MDDIKQELIKVRRSEQWRIDLRKALSNKDRIALPAQQMAELSQEPSFQALYIEDKQGLTAEQAMAEARRCLDCPTPGCVEACPAHIHIPTFIKQLEVGDLGAAWHTLRERSTLSAICSRVCDHDKQCEGGCVYHVSLKQRAVGIGALERYVATYEYEHREHLDSLCQPELRQGKRVAIVGFGPSGMAAAHDLALYGYEVEIYEMLHRPGGVMRTGIPRFRLPEAVIEDEVARLESYGVKVHYGVRIGCDLTIDDLRDRYNAVYLATGAGLSNMMGVEGEELDGVHRADQFLWQPNMAEDDAREHLYDLKGKQVAIVGGGNTAMDAARVSRRLGAQRVIVIYRRGMEEMPAGREEIQYALREGIEFMTLHQVKRYLPDDNGHVDSVELIEMALAEPDESGRRKPIPTGQIKTIPIDEVVVCVGVAPDPSLPMSAKGLETKWGSVIIVDDRQRTSIPRVYAGGDASRGGATVVLAMRDGREAAKSIHEALSV